MNIYLFKFKLKISKIFITLYKNYVRKILNKNKGLFLVNIFQKERRI